MASWVPTVESAILTHPKEQSGNQRNSVSEGGHLDLAWVPGGLLPHHLWALAFYLRVSKRTTSLKYVTFLAL